MEQLLIKGPSKLSGEVKISGSKNAALPIIASSILFGENIYLKNIPRIKDVEIMLKALESLGISYDFKGNNLKIDPSGFKGVDPKPKIIKKLRASLLLIAPLLIRNKRVRLPHPGGCLIGSRPIDFTIEGLRKMGAKSKNELNDYILSAKKLKPENLYAEFSVTGTENLIMAAVLTEGTTKISLAAAEPHVQDFCNFLVKSGAKIKGIGSHSLTIEGVSKLKGTEYEIIPDQIESGTFAIAAAASKSSLSIKGFVADHHESLLSKFNRANVSYRIISPTEIKISPSLNLLPFKIRTEVYPGFPTDLQAPMAILATQANGSSEIYETIFEGRLGYINELSKMGASCVIRDAHQATITGPTPLYSARITSFDLRAGATLIIAALIAQGESRLDQIEIIDRGYEGIEDKFKKLGAEIKRIKLKEVL